MERVGTVLSTGETGLHLYYTFIHRLTNVLTHNLSHYWLNWSADKRQ